MLYNNFEELNDAISITSKPGDTIADSLEYMGLTQTELAERMNRPLSAINEIISGTKMITEDTAAQLETVFGPSANFWLKLEANYRQELFEFEQERIALEQLEWLNHFPLPELAARGIIEGTVKSVETLHQLLKYCKVAGITAFENTFMGNKRPSVSYRILLPHTPSAYVLGVWLSEGEHQAAEIEVPAFDKKQFNKVLLQLRKFTNTVGTNALTIMQEHCQPVGVKVIHTPAYSTGHIEGAARWIANNPTIQLASIDSNPEALWFTFFHEAGHLMLHGKKDKFLEGFEGFPYNLEKEAAANEFARKHIGR